MRRVFKKYLRWLKWPIRLLVAWFILHTGWMLWDGFSDERPAGKAVVVVLGNKVNEDGSPSPRLAARLDKALELYQSGDAEKIILSGGLGKEGHPEGTVMKAYLEQKGIPSAALIADDRGNTTWMTAENVRGILAGQDPEMLVVSQYYHLSRSKMALRRMGFTQVRGVHADFQWEWRDVRSVIREFPGYYCYLIRSGE
jgi:vancomycin permeability regulator SanA